MLSVVCLVLAAMSMRFQDMCDDYKSLRNAEKAALKLQKHRLKYMKSHQINQFKHGKGPGSAGSGQILIDDFHIDNVIHPTEAESNNVRNVRAQNNNNKSIQFQNNWLDQNNCRVPMSAFTNGQRSGCENCASRRLLAHDDLMMAGGKHSSWLHPCFHMQGHSRLIPLFGAGSSVGTFFPKRNDDHGFRASGSADAQILIDGQPTHGCTGMAQGIARSKSILSRSNNNLAPNKHAAVFESSCIHANHECDHANHRHICHNHHHHKCNHHNQNNETSASDESELAVDDGHLTCGNLFCSGNHLHQQQHSDCANNRIKLTHLAKLNNQLSSGWKKQLSDQVRVTNQRGGTFQQDNHNSRLNNNHHNQQQTTSDESSSPAQCTCSRDHQPLISATRHHSPNRTNHKRLAMRQDLRAAAKQQTKRDKSIPVWSTNRDRLI